MTALREIRMLQVLKHKNIINLVEICRAKGNPYYTQRHHCCYDYIFSIDTPYNGDKGSVYLVLDFCEHDLAGLLECKEVHFSLGEIKNIMQQLFNALSYIHGNNILHRDMKSSNILMTHTGKLKLADFGLARALNKGPNQCYTNGVVTLWYRPPELLLGERNYGPPVDMWSAGCIMAEMWTRRPIIQGDTEQKQITLICQLCGSIIPEEWPGVDKLEHYQKLELPAKENRKVRERLHHFVKDTYALDLIENLLVLDPKKRIDADATLDHDFFWKDPLPTDLTRTLSALHSSMFVMHTGSYRPVIASRPGQLPSNVVAGHFHDRVF